MSKTLLIGTAACVLGLAAAPAAHAAVVYEASATTTLTLVSVTNNTNAEAGDSELAFAVNAFVRAEDVILSGDATGETETRLNPNSIDNALAAGESVSNGGTVRGRATDGTSEAFVDTFGEMTVSNLSATDTLTVQMELSFSLAAFASLDNALGETADIGAFATIESSIVGDVDATVEQGGVATALSDAVLAFALESSGGDADLSDSATLLITFVLAPGAAVDMFMRADVFGFAEGMVADADAVPLPGAFGLMAAGLVGIGAARRRKGA